MEKVINLQMGIFGNFSDIKPNIELASKIGDSLLGDGFIPSTINVNMINPNTKKMEIDTRFQMISNDRNWAITYLQDRIDINYNNNDGSYLSFEEIVDKAIDLCEKSFSSIKTVSGYRVALSGNFVLNKLEGEEKKKFVRRFINPPSFYKNELIEWNVRYNSPIKIRIQKELKDCNFIVQLGDFIEVNNITNKKDVRTILYIDINTSHKKIDNTFSYRDLIFFVSKAFPLAKQAIDDIEEGTH